MLIRARVTSLLSILLLALVVSACGGADDPGADDDASGTALDASGAASSEPADGEDPRRVVEEYVNAVESCATVNVDGTYTGCLDTARLLEEEPALADAPGETTVEPADDPRMSYQVTTTLDGAAFTETHKSDGNVTRACDPADAPGCESGSW